jgi:NAD-dependent SIR2 family protein deacetylase
MADQATVFEKGAVMSMCANCGKRFENKVEFAIHRDGFGIEPEVPLCHDCGAYPRPTCEEIWFNIADRRARQRASDHRSD